MNQTIFVSRRTLASFLGLVAVFLFAGKAAADSCTYAVAPTSVTNSADSEAGRVTVTATGTDCSPWTATSDASWATVSAPTYGYAGRVLRDGAAAYWRLGESDGTVAVDATGHGAQGTFGSGVTLQQAGALGDGTSAAQFNGTSGARIVVPPSAYLVTPTGVTFETWVKTTTQWGWLASTANNTWELYVTTGGKVQLRTRLVGEGGPQSLIGTQAVNDGQWHHVVMTWNGTLAVLYIDGVADGQQGRAGTLDGALATLRIGQDAGGGTSFTGTLDDVAIYARALSGTEVAEHYALAPHTSTSGSGAATYVLASNPTTSVRTGTLTIAGQAVTVTQDAAPACTYAVSPTSATSVAGGSTGVVSVTATGANCSSWTATSAASWVTVSAPTYGYAGQALHDGAAAYWRLGESSGTVAADATGHGVAGTVGSGVTLQQAGALGDDTSAAQFNGTSGAGIVVPPSAYLVTPTGVTFETWVKTTTQWGWLASTANNTWELYVTTGGKVQLRMRLVGEGGPQSLIGTQAVNDGQWHHVMMTWNGSLAILYIDGVADAQQGRAGTLDGALATLRIGQDAGGGTSFTGTLDEVAIYAHALTAAQAAEHYARRADSGTTGSGTTTFTVAANPTTSARTATLTIAGATVTVTQDAAPPPPVPPTVTIRLTDPFPGTTFVQPSAIDVRADVTVANGTVVAVDFFADATLVGQATTSPYQIVWSSPATGTHSLTAIAIDSVGGTKTSSPVSITVGASGTGFGILGAPIASPSGGVYGTGEVVTLVAVAGATIRYTTDGSIPTATSPMYTGPITLTQTATLKAQAYKDGWTSSALTVEIYQIDTAPPTITFTLLPAPNSAGWNNRPVTATFSCTDNLSGVGTCPLPLTFTQEGANQIATVTASDQVGNQTTMNVVVSIDKTPVAVTIGSPSDGGSTTESSLVLNGEVSDLLSGLASAACNGELAEILSGTVECTVSLRPGLNSIVLHTTDVAGNSSSKGIRVMRSAPPMTLMITPHTQTLVVGESRQLVAAGESGPITSGITWTSSDSDILSMSSDGQGVITADSLGEVTVTAAVGDLTAEATVTVVTSLAPGTVRWTVAPTPGLVMSPPIYTNRVETAADLFTVEADTEGTSTIVRALRADGVQLWTETAPGVPLFGDVFGGIVAEIRPQGSHYRLGVARFGGGADARPWRYDAPNWGILPEGGVVQAPDGTIYFVEGRPVGLNGNTEGSLVALNGSTGQVKFKVSLPRSTSQVSSGSCSEVPPGVHDSAHFVASSGYDFGTTSRLSIGIDGAAYVAISNWHDHWRRSCHVRRTGSEDFPFYVDILQSFEGDGTMERTRELKLIRVGASGAATEQTLWQSHILEPDTHENLFTHQEFGYPQVTVPDGIGGTLVTWVHSRNDEEDESRITRVVGGGISEHTEPRLTYYSPIYMVGDNGIAYLEDDLGLRVVDVASWQTKGIVSTGGAPTAVMALAGGGVVVRDDNGVTAYDESGVNTSFFATSLLDPSSSLEFGMWQGLDFSTGSLVTVAGSALAPSNLSPQTVPGNIQKQIAYPMPFKDPSIAALAALDYLYPYSAAKNWEWGGLVCEQFNGYLWSRPVTSHIQDQVLVLGQTSCLPYGTAVALYHTHPPRENPDPSGDDIDNANSHPELTFYLKSPKPDGNFPPLLTQSLRFLTAITGGCQLQTCVGEPGSAERHTFERVGGTWIPYLW